jgi:hypothetical protein
MALDAASQQAAPLRMGSAFGKACADAYSKSLQEQFLKENNASGLMEHVENEVSLRDGTLISIEHFQ